MEVILDKQYPVAAGLDAAWTVLSNIPELATCMAGAQITEEIDARHYRGSVRVKVGPAVAAFAGTLEVLSLDPATRTLRLLGKGADKGGSSASMALTARLLDAGNGSSTLEGHAGVIVNGKFAQFGGRMMSSISDVILAQFAETFSQKAQGVQAVRVAQASAAAAATAPKTTAEAAAPTAAAPAAPVAATELNALAVAWMLIRNFFAGLLGRKS
jgi:carbon monoxide dehydrogenase subunit G